jgi:hypothetical protein
MSNHKKPLVATLLFLMLTAMIVPLIKAAEIAPSQLVYYFPDDQTATLYGTDFAPNSTVTIIIAIVESPDYTYSDTIVTDASGSFTYNYALTGMELTYLVTATDEAGNTATTSFLDPIGYAPSAVTSSDSSGTTKSITSTYRTLASRSRNSHGNRFFSSNRLLRKAQDDY